MTESDPSAVLSAGAALNLSLSRASVQFTLNTMAEERLARAVAASSRPGASPSAAPERRSTFVIGSRESDLAMIQTRHVRSMLSKQFPHCRFEIRSSSTWGDDVQDKPLAQLAAQCSGLFTKDLEKGLLLGRYDLVVHSLKDMPTTLPEGLTLAAITEREDPRDALVVAARHRGCGGLAGLPEGALVGTSSVRRVAIIRSKHPHLRTADVRGNVPTRLRKLDRPEDFARPSGSAAGAVEYDALLLAAAGLERSGLGGRIEARLPPSSFPYGVGQGALGVECRTDDARVRAMLRAVEHGPTALRCRAERAFLRRLQGGCQVPVGVVSAYDPASQRLSVEGTVMASDGAKTVASRVDTVVSGAEAADAAGDALGMDVIARGAGEVIGKALGEGRPLSYSEAATGDA
jgi:hydroxymethylbilane synthase